MVRILQFSDEEKQRIGAAQQGVVRGVLGWEAQTRRQRSRTRVQSNDARGTLLPARQCRIQLFFLFHNSRRLGPTRHRLGLICAESG